MNANRRVLSSREVLSLAEALRLRGAPAAAENAYRHVLKAEPENAAAHAGLGNILAAASRYVEAETFLSRALELGGASAELHNDLGAALVAIGRRDEAVAQFRLACALQPDFAIAHSNLGNALAAEENFREAVASYRKAIALDPNLAEAHGNLGTALLDLLHPEDAIAHLNRAIELDPSLIEVENTRGNALVMLGDLAGAHAAFTRAAAGRPGDPEYYAGLTRTERLAADDPRLQALEAMARDTSRLRRGARVPLHFALHRAYEAQGRHAESFAQLLEGNKLRREVIEYDEAKATGLIERIKTVFGPAMLRRAPRRGRTPDLPIFILGMPRSGSTLIEQILSSHHGVTAAGELMLLAHTATRFDASGTLGLPYPDNMIARRDDEFVAMGDYYRGKLRRAQPGAARITDKMPANFHHVGLIRMILPNARIIHTRRDPVDTCLSCFAQTFAAGLGYTNELREMGRYYRAYAGLMAHWRAVLEDDFMLEVEYADVVTDFAAQVRRILDYCGLDWDPACLAFYENKRPVMTASGTQVRRPIYRDSLERGARYGALLDPLREALG